MWSTHACYAVAPSSRRLRPLPPTRIFRAGVSPAVCVLLRRTRSTAWAGHVREDDRRPADRRAALREATRRLPDTSNTVVHSDPSFAGDCLAGARPVCRPLGQDRLPQGVSLALLVAAQPERRHPRFRFQSRYLSPTKWDQVVLNHTPVIQVFLARLESWTSRPSEHPPSAA